jgi:shikimate kinase
LLYKFHAFFYQLLSEINGGTVMALSSGFLVHEGLDALVFEHRVTLQKEGVTIVLLPSHSLEESTEIVVTRQLARGFGLVEDKERVKFMDRYSRYQAYGDTHIYSYEAPEAMADHMLQEL